MTITRCYVFSVLLYIPEGLTMNKEKSLKLGLYKGFCHVGELTLVEDFLNKDFEVLFTITKSKRELFREISQDSKFELLQLIMHRKIEGPRWFGRRRISQLRNFKDWFGLSSADLPRTTISKVRVAMRISKVHSAR